MKLIVDLNKKDIINKYGNIRNYVRNNIIPKRRVVKDKGVKCREYGFDDMWFGNYEAWLDHVTNYYELK
jgi:hypothetical protein